MRVLDTYDTIVIRPMLDGWAAYTGERKAPETAGIIRTDMDLGDLVRWFRHTMPTESLVILPARERTEDDREPQAVHADLSRIGRRKGLADG